MYLGFHEPVARISVCLSRPGVVLAWSVVVAACLMLLLTPIITTLLSPCPSLISSSIFLPNSCHLSQHYFSNSTPLPTLIALSYKTYSNHHHIQPFSAHWFWAHTCSPNINSSSTLPFTAPLPFFIIYVLLGYSC